MPYATPGGYGTGNFCPLSKNMDGGIVILGDRGPGNRFDRLSKWSVNHPTDGESLLYVAGNVKFSRDIGGPDKYGETSLNAGGWGGNNVYNREAWTSATYHTETPVLNYYMALIAPPSSTKDTVLWSWE